MQYDIAVIGFGTAGSIAAIAAVRQGMKVLVVEKNNYPGGTHTGGCICGYYDGEPAGLTAELNRLTQDKIKDSGYLHPIAPQEIKKMIFEQEVLVGGGIIHYGAWVTGVTVQNKAVTGISWHDEKGMHSAEATIVIDATADAVVCTLAGCELSKGREGDGLFQQFTNSSAYLYPNETVWTANPDAGRIDQTNAAEYSKTILESATVHLRESFTDSPNRLIFACDMLGLREGPLVIAEDRIRFSDVINGICDYSEPVAWTRTFPDSHAKDYAFESEAYQDWMLSSTGGEKYWFGVTRGALIPRGFTGLLIAGRHVGGDRDIHFALRMNGVVSKMGEAAGELAALAVKLNCSPLQVPYQDLAERVNPGESPLALNDEVWGDLGDAELAAALASETPSRAFWASRMYGKAESLKAIVAKSTPKSDLHSASALALGLMGNDSSLPDLREMARTMDSYPFGRYSDTRGLAATYCLGKLRDPQAVGILLGLLSTAIKEKHYAYASYSVMALLKIGDSVLKQRDAIGATLVPLAEDGTWALKVELRKGILTRRDPLLRIHIAARLKRWGVPNRIATTLKTLELTLNEANLCHRAVSA